MKTILTLTIFLFAFSFACISQSDQNKWAIDVYGGINKTWTSRGQATKISVPHLAIGGRYMANNRFGVKLGFDYNRFGSAKTNFSHVSLYSVTGSAVINIGNILKFHSFSKWLGLLANIGAGASFLKPKNVNATDKMLHGTVGFTPQFKVSPRIAINLYLSTTLNIGQQRRFDGSKIKKAYSFDGTYSNLSVGLSFYLGKHKSHIDWAPTEYGSNGDNEKYDAYEARIAELEKQLSDDDGDGVPNHLDLEPNTSKDEIVDSKGRAIIDSDGDKIPDSADLCPNKKGLYSDNGCPDSDGDGIDDLNDKCPDLPGVLYEQGCPAVEREIQKVMEAALKGVQFETGKDVILKRSFKVLDKVVEVMKDRPEYYLDINGHTDNIGNPESNMELSIKRAKAVANYLISKGVEKERLHPKGFGETKPKVSNETDAGRAQNRRVEFKVVFE